MKRTPISRRQVLRGAGGLCLGLPFLPSLLPRAAWGQAAPRTPRFVAFSTEQGGIWHENMYPGDAALTDMRALYPTHDIRHGTLVAPAQGNRAVISPVLSAASSALTPRILGKMNLLRGIDVPFYNGHNWGCHLGNFRGLVEQPTGSNIESTPTIDQVLAWSDTFYPNLDGVKQRTINTGHHVASISWGYSNPAAGSGSLQKTPAEVSSVRMFDALIAGAQPPPPGQPQPRQPIVDRILESYRNLRQSNRRLSTGDRQRLDDHIGRLDELDRKVAVVAAVECHAYQRPTQDSDSFGKYPFQGVNDGIQTWDLLTDVLTMAMACGVSRIATASIKSTFSDHAGNWHMDVAHQATSPGAQKTLSDGLQLTFEHAILSMANKMDAVEFAPGRTLLDDSLIQWTQESGTRTHHGQGNPVVTFGSAGGFLKTGQYIDYRNRRSNVKLAPFGFDPDADNLGLLHRQWLATALQAMGLSPSEFERNGKPGYGSDWMHASYTQVVRPEVISNASEVMPLLKA